MAREHGPLSPDRWPGGEQSQAPASHISPASQQHTPGDPPPTANAGFPLETNICLPTSHADCLPRGEAQKGACFSSVLPGEPGAVHRQASMLPRLATVLLRAGPRDQPWRGTATGPPALQLHPQGHRLISQSSSPKHPSKLSACLPRPVHPALPSQDSALNLSTERAVRLPAQAQRLPGGWLPPALS